MSLERTELEFGKNEFLINLRRKSNKKIFNELRTNFKGVKNDGMIVSEEALKAEFDKCILRESDQAQMHTFIKNLKHFLINLIDKKDQILPYFLDSKAIIRLLLHSLLQRIEDDENKVVESISWSLFVVCKFGRNSTKFILQCFELVEEISGLVVIRKQRVLWHFLCLLELMIERDSETIHMIFQSKVPSLLFSLLENLITEESYYVLSLIIEEGLRECRCLSADQGGGWIKAFLKKGMELGVERSIPALMHCFHGYLDRSDNRYERIDLIGSVKGGELLSEAFLSQIELFCVIKSLSCLSFGDRDIINKFSSSMFYEASSKFLLTLKDDLLSSLLLILSNMFLTHHSFQEKARECPNLLESLSLLLNIDEPTPGIILGVLKVWNSLIECFNGREINEIIVRYELDRSLFRTAMLDSVRVSLESLSVLEVLVGSWGSDLVQLISERNRISEVALRSVQGVDGLHHGREHGLFGGPT